MAKIRVMIVEDSFVIRAFLQAVIGRDPRLEVVATVTSGEEALRVLHRVSPDVISMDVRLPGMNGLEATQRIMTEKPTPIVVVSASVEAEDLKISLNALRAGALAVVEKPVGTSHADYEAVAERLCTQLAIMSQVAVIRQRFGRGLTFGSEEAAVPARVRPPARSPNRPQLLGLVASTGGPSALVQVLSQLPPGFPVPILVVQHIMPSFLEGFVDWLGGLCPFTAVVAQDGDIPVAGKVYVAPADRHLRVQGWCLRLDQGGLVCQQRPSGTVLFRSMAQSVGAGAIGVLLTGMGEDGAEGLKDIRDAGGYTLAEDESTAVVYGMPAAALRLGGVCEACPLQDIAPRIRQLVLRDREGI
jgi:two-component system chemotaxis response regulator CheB